MGHLGKDFAGDRYALAGYWAPSTSAANFCEEDYAITLYLAEFINTLTNLAYVYFALRYPRSPKKQNTGGYYFDSMSFTLLLVGIGSFIFHATLHQETQYMDDLSMFALTTALIQRLYAFDKSPQTQRTIATVIVATVVAISAIYIRSGNLAFHTNTFAGFLSLIWPRTLYLIYYRQRSQQQKSKMIKQFGRAVVALVTAFAIWNVDLHKCLEMRGIRHEIGLPWAWLLEGHGWWHILTAVGANEYISLIRELSEE